MATTLYLVSNINAPNVNERFVNWIQYTALDGSTTFRSSGGPYTLRTSRGSSATNTIESSVAGATNGVETIYWFVSPPVSSSFNLSNLITCNLCGYESSMSANATLGARIGYISRLDGTFTEIGKGTWGTEVGTSETVANFSFTPTSTSISRGDRIAIIPYWDDATSTTMGAGYTLRVMFNGPTAGQSGDSYVTFADNFGFESSSPSGTTIYPTTTSAGINPGSATEYEAWTSRGSGATSSVTNTVAGPTNGVQITGTAGGTAIEWYTKPLSAGSLSGSALVHLRAKSSLASGTGLVRCEIALTNEDGTNATVIGTGQSGTNTGYNGLTSSEASADFLVPCTTNITAGKRLRIRFYLDDNAIAIASGYTTTVYYAGAASGSGDTYITLPGTVSENPTTYSGTFTADAYIKRTIGSGSPTVFQDTFTATDGTYIAGSPTPRYPDIGPLYTTSTGYVPLIIEGNVATSSSNGQSARNCVNLGFSNFTLEADISVNAGNVNNFGEVYFRSTANQWDYGYGFVIANSNRLATGFFRLDNTTQTFLWNPPSANLNANQTYHIKAVLNGSSIKFYLDGDLKYDGTDSAHTTRTYVGIHANAQNTSEQRTAFIDNLTVVANDNRTFTADAEISEGSSATTYSGTFTANAHIAKNDIPGTFTANANISKLDIPGSFTADAYVRKNDIQGTFTADATIVKTTESSFTANAFIQNTLSGSFSADAHIQNTFSGSFTADAYIAKTTEGSFTADAHVSKTTEGTFTANANIKKTIPGTFTADAYIKRTFVYGVGGGVTVAQDTFTDTDRSLTAHTPEIGGSWSNLVSIPQIKSNKAGIGNGVSAAGYLGSVSVGDGDIYGTISGGRGFHNYQSIGQSSGVMARVASSGPHAYLVTGVEAVEDGYALVYLWRLTSGGAVLLSEINVGVALPWRVRLQVSGSSPTTIKVRVWQDGTSEPGTWSIETSDNTSSNQMVSGSVGVYEGNGYSSGEYMAVDDFLAVSSGGSVDGTGPTVDAYISKTTSGSVTANAFIKNTLSGSFSADSNIASTVSGTFTADAYIQNTIAGSFSADAYLSSGTTYSGSFTADAHISKTSEQSFTADAYVKNTIASSLTADAYVQATSSGSFSADAFIQKTTAGSFTTDAFLKNTISGSFTADAVVSKTVPGSFTADAHVTNTISSSFTADATVSKTYPGSFSADAYVQATIPGSLTANAYVQNTLSGSFSADAYVQSAIGGTFTADAYISKTTSSSFTADAEIVLPDATTYPGSFTADANIKATVSGSVSSDAYIKSTIEGSVTADAYVQNTLSGELTADAHIKKTVAGSFTSDAMVQRTFEGSFSADAIVLKVNPGSFSADSYVQATTSGSFSADAYIQNTIGGSLTADAYVLRTQAGSFSVDAHVQKETSQTFSVDAYISKVGKIVWTTPGNTDAITSTPTFAFRIPPATGNMHFHIELDTVDTFDGASYRSHKSHFDQTGWEYYNGSSWVPITAAGVSNTYAGNEARYTVQTALPNATWYRRVRGGV